MDIIKFIASTVKDNTNAADATGASSKAQTAVDELAKNTGASSNLNDGVKWIINGIITVVGVVAVIMIILGGINYATSQGDAAKVKKGKDTILYGIIGLVIVILAFAIVNFVLGALK